MFSGMIESTEEAQLLVKHDSIVPLNKANILEEKKIGWALRRTDRTGSLDSAVKKEVEILVRSQLDQDRRAEAREIRDQLQNAKLPNGSYKFTLKKCLSESQIKTQITRILNMRKKENTKDAEKNGKEPSPKVSKKVFALA